MTADEHKAEAERLLADIAALSAEVDGLIGAVDEMGPDPYGHPEYDATQRKLHTVEQRLERLATQAFLHAHLARVPEPLEAVLAEAVVDTHGVQPVVGSRVVKVDLQLERGITYLDDNVIGTVVAEVPPQLGEVDSVIVAWDHLRFDPSENVTIPRHLLRVVLGV